MSNSQACPAGSGSAKSPMGSALTGWATPTPRHTAPRMVAILHLCFMQIPSRSDPWAIGWPSHVDACKLSAKLLIRLDGKHRQDKTTSNRLVMPPNGAVSTTDNLEIRPDGVAIARRSSPPVPGLGPDLTGCAACRAPAVVVIAHSFQG